MERKEKTEQDVQSKQTYLCYQQIGDKVSDSQDVPPRSAMPILQLVKV